MKADKTFASRAKRKRKKENGKRKEKCAYLSEQTLPRQAQVFLTAAMHDVGIRCVDLGHVALHSATLFLSSVVRACCDSAVDFTGKTVVSVVAMFKIEVVIDFYVTKQRVSTFWGVCRLLGCSRRAPSAAVRLPTVAYIVARNQTFDS